MSIRNLSLVIISSPFLKFFFKAHPLIGVLPVVDCNVPRLRAMGGDPTCVPPDFNNDMLAIWEDLWHSTK